VLSKSTQTHDRKTKLDVYRRLASLEAYVILHQHGAKAQVFLRQGGAWNEAEQVGGVLELTRGLRVDLDAL
jgi:hypothetical protein